jgi:hypothetical protein
MQSTVLWDLTPCGSVDNRAGNGWTSSAPFQSFVLKKPFPVSEAIANRHAVELIVECLSSSLKPFINTRV